MALSCSKYQPIGIIKYSPFTFDYSLKDIKYLLQMQSIKQEEKVLLCLSYERSQQHLLYKSKAHLLSERGELKQVALKIPELSDLSPCQYLRHMPNLTFTIEKNWEEEKPSQLATMQILRQIELASEQINMMAGKLFDTLKKEGFSPHTIKKCGSSDKIKKSSNADLIAKENTNGGEGGSKKENCSGSPNQKTRFKETDRNGDNKKKSGCSSDYNNSPQSVSVGSSSILASSKKGSSTDLMGKENTNAGEGSSKKENCSGSPSQKTRFKETDRTGDNRKKSGLIEEDCGTFTHNATPVHNNPQSVSVGSSSILAISKKGSSADLMGKENTNARKDSSNSVKYSSSTIKFKKDRRPNTIKIKGTDRSKNIEEDC